MALDGDGVKRLAGVVAAALAAVALGAPVARAGQEDAEEPGRELFLNHCASCHGLEGGGTEYGPSLIGVGEAAADFQLRTGRMPLPYPAAPTLRKPPAFDDEQIALLVDYVGDLGVGPEIPEVDVEGADLQRGAFLFIANCAPCHGATASGGAVGGDAFAPSLGEVIPLDVAEAMLTGPGEMPRFAFGEEDLNAVARYVHYLQEADPAGGLDIGGIGPVAEGYVAWILAIAILLVIVVAVVGAPHGEIRPRALEDGDD